MTSTSITSLDAFEIVLWLTKSNPEIETVHVATLDFAPPLEARVNLTDADVFVMKAAMDLRDSLALPFWEGVMISVSRFDSVAKQTLRAASYHQELAEKTEALLVATLTTALLREKSEDAEHKGKMLAITSKVGVKGGKLMHIPMLDFHLKCSPHGTEVVCEVLRLIGAAGALLRSGKSYHFYGTRLLSTQEWIGFLGKALLYAPIVDRAWVAHQLIEEACALRLSPRKEYGGSPVCVCEVV